MQEIMRNSFFPDYPCKKGEPLLYYAALVFSFCISFRKKDHTFVWPGEQSKRVTRLVYISIPLEMEIKESPGPYPAINLPPAG